MTSLIVLVLVGGAALATAFWSITQTKSRGPASVDSAAEGA